MQKYKITRRAEADLLGIWQYTAENWGKMQADAYLNTIETCFNAIAEGSVISKQPLAHYKKLHCVRCRHHYIFFLTGRRPIMLAILHEKMDFIARLKVRLG